MSFTVALHSIIKMNSVSNCLISWDNKSNISKNVCFLSYAISQISLNTITLKESWIFEQAFRLLDGQTSGKLLFLSLIDSVLTWCKFIILNENVIMLIMWKLLENSYFFDDTNISIQKKHYLIWFSTLSKRFEKKLSEKISCFLWISVQSEWNSINGFC